MLFSSDKKIFRFHQIFLLKKNWNNDTRKNKGETIIEYKMEQEIEQMNG